MAAGRNIGISRYPTPKIIIVAQPSAARYNLYARAASAGGDHGNWPVRRFTAISPPAPAPATKDVEERELEMVVDMPHGTRAGRQLPQQPPTHERQRTEDGHRGVPDDRKPAGPESAHHTRGPQPEAEARGRIAPTGAERQAEGSGATM